MPKKIKVYKAALKDIETTAICYQAQQKGLGKRFEEEVHPTFKRIQKFPFSASILSGHIRYKVIGKFPHIVLYEFDEKNIYILRVFNTHQDAVYYVVHLLSRTDAITI